MECYETKKNSRNANVGNACIRFSSIRSFFYFHPYQSVSLCQQLMIKLIKKISKMGEKMGVGQNLAASPKKNKIAKFPHGNVGILVCLRWAHSFINSIITSFSIIFFCYESPFFNIFKF